MGRVAVIGGSEDYTGAPYFSAVASARLGADMVCSWMPSFGNRLIIYTLQGGAPNPGNRRVWLFSWKLTDVREKFVGK